MKRPTNLSVMSSKAGLPPGTLIHVGNKLTNDVKITVMNYSETVFEQVEVSTAQEAHDLNRPDCVSWINVDGLHEIKLIEELGEPFWTTSSVIGGCVEHHTTPERRRL